jgi:hypothetical protein
VKKFLFLVVVFIVGFFSSAFLEEDDLAKYIVKYKSEWGKSCLQCIEAKGTYRVYLKNTYTEKLDIRLECRRRINDGEFFNVLVFHRMTLS